MKTLVTFALALVFHLLIGWQWTLLAGIIGGAWTVRRGWLVGLLGGAFSWAALVAYNFIVAEEPARILVDTLGGIIGNTSGSVIVALTVLIGGVLGLLGGTIGGQAARLMQRKPSEAKATS